jgi:hypothetical protein
MYSSCLIANPSRSFVWELNSFVDWFSLVRQLTQQILQVVQLTKFDYRLANNLDEELQKLRCRVNYHALRFRKPIQQLGQRLVLTMRKMAKHFIAVHLRFVSVTFKYKIGLLILKFNWCVK